MFKKILSCLLFLNLGSVFAQNINYEISPSLSIEWEFPSKIPVVITNYTIFPLTGVCTIEASEVISVHVKVLNRSGTVNEKEMSKGDEDDIFVKSGDTLRLTAQPAAQVELTNNGSTTFKAICKA